MATRYITNTNATGPGTLVAALGAAQAGDTIAPDPTLFADGETVDIDLVSLLKIPVALTIDAGKTRLVLRRSRYNLLLENREQTGFNDLTMRGVTLVGRVLVGGNASKRLTCAFEKCVFGGFSNAYNLFQTSGYVDATMTDCAFVGGTSRGIYLYGENNFATFTRCTIAANKNTVSLATSSNSAFVDCVVDPPLESAGFCNVPSSLDEYSESNPIPWRAWNFAPRGDSPYASGGSTCAGKTDLLGVARGWTDANGETQHAVGAFEVVDADYFLARDAGTSVSFADPSRWRRTRGGDAAPESVGAGVFFVDESVEFSDAPPEGSSVIVAGPSGCAIRGGTSSTDSLRVGSRSTLTLGGDAEKDGEDASRRFAQAARVDVAAEGTLRLEVDARVETLDVAPSGRVEFDGEDRVLAASGGWLDAGAILSAESRGYLAFGASGTDAGAVFEGVVLCDAGSGVVDFRVAATRPREAEASWRVAEDGAGEGTAFVERRDSDGKWCVVVSDLPIAALGATIPIPSGRSRYRLFDGWEFHYDDAWSFSGVQFSVVTSATPRCETPRVHWEATTQLATTNDQVYLGQGVTILARIYDSFDSTSLLLAKDDRVQEVRYSCRYVSKGLFEETLEPVAGHEDVVAPVESVLEAAQRSDAWTRDDEGYSFALTPDIREYPLFERAGKYVFKITISLKDANPVVFYVNVEAVEE